MDEFADRAGVATQSALRGRPAADLLVIRHPPELSGTRSGVRGVVLIGVVLIGVVLISAAGGGAHRGRISRLVRSATPASAA
jgi:hypothetical protein